MKKRIKTNIILLIISVLSVLGESMYWVLRSAEDHFPNETAFEEFVSTNPFTIMIAVAFATPVLSFICALFSFTVAFYLLGIILFSGIFGIFDIFSLVVVIIALVVIALIFCVVRSLSFGVRISDVFYERIVFVLTNPLIHFLGYFYALFYEMSKEPFHFP